MSYSVELNHIFNKDVYQLKQTFIMLNNDVIENIYKQIYIQNPQTNIEYCNNFIISSKVNRFIDFYSILDWNATLHCEYMIIERISISTNMVKFKEFIAHYNDRNNILEYMDKLETLNHFIILYICFKYKIYVKIREQYIRIKYSDFTLDIIEKNLNIIRYIYREEYLTELIDYMIHNDNFKPIIFEHMFNLYPCKYMFVNIQGLYLVRKYLNKRNNIFVDQTVNNILLKSSNSVNAFRLFNLLSDYPFIYLSNYMIVKKTILMLLQVNSDDIKIMIFIYVLYVINLKDASIILLNMLIANYFVKIIFAFIINLIIEPLEKAQLTCLSNLEFIYNNRIFAFILSLMILFVFAIICFCCYYLANIITMNIIP